MSELIWVSMIFLLGIFITWRISHCIEKELQSKQSIECEKEKIS